MPHGRSRGAWICLLIGPLALIGCGGNAAPTNPSSPSNAQSAPAQEPFSKLTGDTAVGAVKEGGTLEVPFILWGGDVATFHANGGLATKPGTIFNHHGLDLKLTPGDNFPEQVKGYLSGRTPFLRGTFSMLGQASEVLNADPRTRPVVFLQLTWSAGDHMVSRAGLRTLNDLKPAPGKKKVALQRRGPHVGMLGDVLRTARIGWGEVEVVWTDDVTGPKGPAELFKKDGTIDACFAITPDMVALTGGLDKEGTGRDGTVKGAHVLVSTASLSRSIADVYACRKDFYDAHRKVVEKFAAGYLKACEELLDIKKRAGEKDKDALAQYKAILEMTKGIYGKEAVPDDDAADGLISDAAFVGLPGNIGFFTEKGNLSNFEGKQKVALDIATELHDITSRTEFIKPDFDYDALRLIGGLTGQSSPPRGFGDDVKFLPENTIYFFTIGFEPDQSDFPESRYGEDFQRALEQASLFGKAGIAVRGHADPTNLMNAVVKIGRGQGAFQGDPGDGNELRLTGGKTLNLTDNRRLVEMIEKEGFGGQENAALRNGVGYLTRLSQARAEAVRKSVVSFANEKGIRLDVSQIRSDGVGVLEPIFPRARSDEQAAKNRRVEFRIIKVAVEANTTGFDY